MFFEHRTDQQITQSLKIKLHEKSIVGAIFLLLKFPHLSYVKPDGDSRLSSAHEASPLRSQNIRHLDSAPISPSASDLAIGASAPYLNPDVPAYGGVAMDCAAPKGTFSVLPGAVQIENAKPEIQVEKKKHSNRLVVHLDLLLEFQPMSNLVWGC